MTDTRVNDELYASWKLGFEQGLSIAHKDSKEPPKTIRLMSFGEAMAKMKEGYAVRRKEWVHSRIIKDKQFGITRLKTRGDDSKWVERFAPTFEEVEATDWVIAEEGQS